MGIPLAFRWGLNTLTAADTGSILGQETKILEAMSPKKKKKIHTVYTPEFIDELGTEKHLNNYSLQRKWKMARPSMIDRNDSKQMFNP